MSLRSLVRRRGGDGTGAFTDLFIRRPVLAVTAQNSEKGNCRTDEKGNAPSRREQSASRPRGGRDSAAGQPAGKRARLDPQPHSSE